VPIFSEPIRTKADSPAREVQVVVLSADTTVVVGGELLGKPRDDQEVAAMLKRLSGRWHEVMTGVSVRSGDLVIGGVETTRVAFASLSASDIDWYVRSGEGRGKAGAYAIQGLASRFIPRIEGSYSNVVGLPVATVVELLAEIRQRLADTAGNRRIVS
jgi:nucleoside triphosphate pyrophosphatase